MWRAARLASLSAKRSAVFSPDVRNHLRFNQQKTRSNIFTDWPKDAFPVPTLEAPEDAVSPFSLSPFARCLGIRLQNDMVRDEDNAKRFSSLLGRSQQFFPGK
jgi:hypothetical protein